MFCLYLYINILYELMYRNHSLTSKTLCPGTEMHRKVTAVETPFNSEILAESMYLQKIILTIFLYGYSVPMRYEVLV